MSVYNCSHDEFKNNEVHVNGLIENERKYTFKSPNEFN